MGLKQLYKEFPQAQRCASPHWVEGTRWIDNKEPLIPSLGIVEFQFRDKSKEVFYIGGTYGICIPVSHKTIERERVEFLDEPINIGCYLILSHKWLADYGKK